MIDREKAPGISVVIAVDGGKRTSNSLVSVTCTSLPPADFEVLVCVYFRECSPALATAVEKLAECYPIRLVVVHDPGRAALVNAGVASAAGDIILFLGDDIAMTPELLARHHAFHHARPDLLDVAIGPVFFPPRLRTRRFLRWLEDSGHLFGVSFTNPALALPPTYFYQPNTSFKKALFCAAGQSWERLPYHACDDQELGWRMAQLGMRSHYLKEAAGIHHHPVGMIERVRALRRGGWSAYWLLQRHPHQRIWMGPVWSRSLLLRALTWIAALCAHGAGLTRRENVYASLMHFGWLLGYRQAQITRRLLGRDLVQRPLPAASTR